MHLRDLEASERTLGPEHPSTLISVNNLAVLYSSKVALPKRSRCTLRDLEARERTLGPDHPNTLTSVNNLALLYRPQVAMPKRSRCTCGRWKPRSTPWVRSTSTLTSVNNLALLYNSQGRMQKRSRCTCSRWKPVSAPWARSTQHPDQREQPGGALQCSMSPRCSRTSDQRVLEYRQHTLGPEHPSTLISVGNLAGL